VKQICKYNALTTMTPIPYYIAKLETYFSRFYVHLFALYPYLKRYGRTESIFSVSARA